jgi:4-hydroxybenzoyl-CoA reductase subunit beta
MMRLPRFRYLAPRDLDEATAMLADAGPAAAVVAGGTDLWPKMKRRQQTPAVVIGLAAVPGLREERWNGTTLLGANLTLTELLENRALGAAYPGLLQAVGQISTPHLRNMGTLGGNLCLDTRCNYYDQNYEWRRSIDFCMKKDGRICWVAPGSPRCWAVSSSDTAPVLVALSARIHLRSSSASASGGGERVVEAESFFADDGIVYLRKRPEEIVTAVELPSAASAKEGTAWRSVYRKLRRRGAFDFPVLGVAASFLVRGQGKTAVAEAGRLVLGAAGSHPVLAEAAGQRLLGRPLTDETIAEVADEAARLAKPLDNTDYALGFRKRLAQNLLRSALLEIRG